jgi:hypothetical protein
MQWKSDLESLVEQTRAMVQNANQTKLAARKTVEKTVEPVAKPQGFIEPGFVEAALRAETLPRAEPATTAEAAPPSPPATKPAEIKPAAGAAAVVLPPLPRLPPAPPVASASKLSSAAQVTPAPSRPTTKLTAERDDIKQRVEGFKAHQEKMRREREEYYQQMTAKTRAMLRSGLPSDK